MADTFKGIITADGKKRQLPYGSVLETPVSDATLSTQGGFADAKAVGDKFKEVNAETDSLKEDLADITKIEISVQKIKTSELVLTVRQKSVLIEAPVYLEANKKYILRCTDRSVNAYAEIKDGISQIVLISNYTNVDIAATTIFETGDIENKFYTLSIVVADNSFNSKNWMVNEAKYGRYEYENYSENLIVKTDKELSDNLLPANAKSVGIALRNKADITDSAILKKTYNLVNKADLVIGKTLNTNNGVDEVASDGEAYTKEYIPVQEDGFWANIECIIIGYDINKNYIVSRWIQQPFTKANPFPSKPAFVRIIYQKYRYLQDVMVVNTTDPQPYIPNKTIPSDALPIKKTWYYGKKIATLGDSITAMERWQYHVANALGATYTNCGIGGTTVCSQNPLAMWQDIRINGGEYSGYSVIGGGYDGKNVIGIPEDTDVILIMGGVNDWKNGKQLGDITSTDTNEFYGAFKLMLKKLYDRVPTAKVFLMTTPHHESEPNASSVGITLEQYRDAVRNIGKLYGYPVIEVVDCGYNSLNASKYMLDSVHPNGAGGILIANEIFNELLRHEPIYR